MKLLNETSFDILPQVDSMHKLTIERHQVLFNTSSARFSLHSSFHRPRLEER